MSFPTVPWVSKMDSPIKSYDQNSARWDYDETIIYDGVSFFRIVTILISSYNFNIVIF